MEIRSVLILAKAGRMRDGLKTLVSAIPEVKLVGAVSDQVKALKMIEKQKPAFVLLDFDQPDNSSLDLIRQIKRLNHRTRCIITTEMTHNVTPRLAAEADAVLVKGFSILQLSRVFGRHQQKKETEKKCTGLKTTRRGTNRHQWE